MKSRRAFFITSSLLLFTLVFTYFQDKNELEMQYYNARISSSFKTLVVANTAIEKEVLTLNSNRTDSFDKLIELQARHDKAVARLDQDINSYLEEDGELMPRLTRYTEAYNDFEASINQFKSALAIVQNSLNYSLFLSDEVLNSLSREQHQKTAYPMVSALITKVLHQQITQTFPLATAMEQELLKIQQVLMTEAPSQQSNFATLSRHLMILSQGNITTSNSLKNILQSPHSNLLDIFYKHYQEQYNKIDQQGRLYSYVAWISFILSLLAAFYSAYRMMTHAGRLSFEKEGLESEITESKAVLKQSNIELKKEIARREIHEVALQDADIFYQHCIQGVVICDSNRKVIRTNNAFSQITGIQQAQMKGRVPAIFNDRNIDSGTRQSILASIEGSGKWHGEVITTNGDGSSSYKEVSIIALRNGMEIHRYIIMLMDISERKKHQETIYRQANYDWLTGLPNRNLFNERAMHTIAQCRRGNRQFAVLFIDIDNFKRINDDLGHTAGDELLQQVANRLSDSVRKTDTVSRFGGDEFIIIMESTLGSHSLETVIQKLIDCISDAVEINGKSLVVSGSVGIAMYPDDGVDISTLIRRADMAMYRAKENGRSTYCFYEEKMNADLLEYLKLETRLRNAVANNELSLVYQPILDLQTGAPRSVEALVRWHQPEIGIIPPDQFIPIAEESGLIVPIGEWILNQACTQLAEWNKAGIEHINMNVNISTLQFKDARLGRTLRDVITKTGIDPKSLTLEITESLFLNSGNKQVLALLKIINKHGISIALDDFGTGYSSLSYLKKFPVNVLKIDRSFICDVVESAGDQSLVQAIISMAKSLNIQVVAEGVEYKEQLDLLQSYGCDNIQGYFYSKPAPAAEIQPLLKSSHIPQKPDVTTNSGE